MSDVGVLTGLLNNFVSVATLGYTSLVPEAMSLLQKFIIIEIVLLGVLSLALGEVGTITATAIKKLLVIGFYI